MPIQDFYRGNTRQFRFEFLLPNPVYTGEPPEISVAAAGTGDYDHITSPLEISSAGMITEFWTLTFSSATEYDISGAGVGSVGEGNISVDTHPNNPDKNLPYWTLKKEGWVDGTIFQAGDTLQFDTINPFVAEDITDLEVTLTFVIEGDDTPIVQISSTAGDETPDDPVNGIMILILHSGQSKLLVEDQYIYGFERREPNIPTPEEDVIRTIEVGKVKILTPAKTVV